MPKPVQPFGAIAQLGERLPCTQEVGSSILPGSTNIYLTKWLLFESKFPNLFSNEKSLLFNKMGSKNKAERNCCDDDYGLNREEKIMLAKTNI